MSALNFVIENINDNLSEIVKNNLLKQVSDELNRKINSKKINRNQQIRELNSAYKKERLVLVLGAGVSLSYGLPTWNTLLQKLILNTIQSETADKSLVIARLFTETFTPSPLISARYLHKYYQEQNKDSKMAFEEAVRKVLYETADKEKESLLFKEILQLCISPGKSPNLDSIITYNYDDILESHLERMEIDIPFKAIYSVGMNPESNELPIYHVHGYLPEAIERITSDNAITLSESNYHEQYNDVYSWNNIVQINKFRDYNCLFIGTSFTDPNLRRLLDIANAQRGSNNGSHYLIRKKYNEHDVMRDLETRLSKDNNLMEDKEKANLKLDEVAKHLISMMESFEENDALSFGVSTIWIDDYNEIPDVLKAFRTYK